jgi:hypothetical protein
LDRCVPAAAAIAASAAVVGKSRIVAVGNTHLGLGCGCSGIYVNHAREAFDVSAVVVNAFSHDGGRCSVNPTRYVKAYPQ